MDDTAKLDAEALSILDEYYFMSLEEAIKKVQKEYQADRCLKSDGLGDAQHTLNEESLNES